MATARLQSASASSLRGILLRHCLAAGAPPRAVLGSSLPPPPPVRRRIRGWSPSLHWSMDQTCRRGAPHGSRRGRRGGLDHQVRRRRRGRCSASCWTWFTLDWC